MRALTVRPGEANSLRLEDVPGPVATDGSLLVRALALGVCGTDREIVAGHYGVAPAGEPCLILGHESLGVVEQAPPGSGWRRGDLVVGIVRHPDPVPCPACAAGEWDMCENGLYTERGIKQRHGFGSDYFRLEPDFAVKVDPALDGLAVLVEPTSVVAKAWDHIDRISARAPYERLRTLLVTGAGPIGLLGALLGVQRGLDVHVLDRAGSGPKPDLVRKLGAGYLLREIGDLEADIVLECTGAPQVVLDAIGHTTHNGIVCLAGVSSGSHKLDFDVSGFNRSMVLQNQLIFGTVNANRGHYEAAIAALNRADKDWLNGLVTRRVPVEQWSQVLEDHPYDIKNVIDFTR